VRITSLHTWGDTPTPDATLSTLQRPLPGDSLLRCSSNAVWWAPDELAFVGPEGCLQIVHVPSGHKVMYVDSQYFLPGAAAIGCCYGMLLGSVSFACLLLLGAYSHVQLFAHLPSSTFRPPSAATVCCIRLLCRPAVCVSSV